MGLVEFWSAVVFPFVPDMVRLLSIKPPTSMFSLLHLVVYSDLPSPLTQSHTCLIASMEAVIVGEDASCYYWDKCRWSHYYHVSNHRLTTVLYLLPKNVCHSTFKTCRIVFGGVGVVLVELGGGEGVMVVMWWWLGGRLFVPGRCCSGVLHRPVEGWCCCLL